MSDLIDRQAAIDAMAELQGGTSSKGVLKGISKAWKRIEQLPPAHPEQLGTNLAEVGTDCISRQAAIDTLKAEIRRMKRSFTICINSDYYTGYMSALSAVEGYIAQMEVADGNHN